MNLSEVFKLEAIRCHNDPIVGYGLAGSDEVNFFFSAIGNFSGDNAAPHFWDDNDHRVLALCMAASIAESEGL